MTTHPQRFKLPALLFVVFAMLPTQVASAQVATVEGTVMDGKSNLVPGLTVSLLHPQLGRSVSVATDASGRFSLDSIPVRPDPYYLEIYWGSQLIYRRALLVTSNGIVAGRLQVPLIVIS